ncbi:hypothetical protein [Algibacter sp. 2305UL17-15]|uniref:hypothetical protein n=1 Tax=Algibacter sp. 2305UL17-15 TaxID=3231268 RepID=UPI003457FEFD
MKAIKIYSLLAILILLASCSKNNDDANNFANAISQQGCPNVVGPTAVYWDYAHGIPAPFSRVPLITNPQGRFNHQAVFTNISVSVPQGYTATQILEQNFTYGMDLRRRNNNQTEVLWRYYPITTFSANLTVDQIRALVINQLMVTEFGFNGTPTVECAPPNQALDFGGVRRVFSSRSITFQNTRAIIWIAVTNAGLNTSSVTISVSAAPINEYNTIVMDVFFPLSFELLIRDKDSLSDRDRDGTPDIDDPEPDNPNVR